MSYLQNQLSPNFQDKQVIFLDSDNQKQTLKKYLPVDSPTRVDSNDLWKSRCNELEQTLCQVNTDMELANFKAKKAHDLEVRLEQILKQNAQLLSENDNLSKNLNQKKTESDIWKTKYDNQTNTIIGLKTNYELVFKKMTSENQKNKELIQLLGEKNSSEIEITKEKLFLEQQQKIESLKENHQKNIQLYEEQVRKLQDIIQARDSEIQEINNRLNNTKNDGEIEYQRLNQENERLRSNIQQIQLDYQQQLDLQRSKKDYQYNEQITAIKKLHQNEIETYESELNKLKNLIQAKNDEISSLVQQNKIQKENFDNHQQDLRNEIKILKDKLIELQEIKEEEINTLKVKLAHLHTTDISEIKQAHEQQENNLLNEIQKLQTLIVLKGEELSIQLKERSELREKFKNENDQLKSEIDGLNFNNSILLREKEQQLVDSSNELLKTNQINENYLQQLKNQIQFLEDQIDELKYNLVKKNNEIDENIQKHKSIKSALEEDLRVLKYQVIDLKKQLENSYNEKERLQEDKDYKYNTMNNLHIDNIRKQELQIDQLENIIKKQRENLYIKDQECDNSLQFRIQAEQECKKSRSEIERLNTQLIQMETLRAMELEDQRRKLQSSNEYHINSLQQSNENQIRILNAQIDELKIMLYQKDEEIQDIIQKQEKMQGIYLELSETKEKHGSDYELKLQKLGSEIVTTKNLYDVFVQSKMRFQKR